MRREDKFMKDGETVRQGERWVILHVRMHGREKILFIRKYM